MWHVMCLCLAGLLLPEALADTVPQRPDLDGGQVRLLHRKLLQASGSAGDYTVYPATNYNRMGDFDCPGSKTPGNCQFDGSQNDAKAKCDSQPGCQGFVYINTQNGFYYLKGGLGSQPLDLTAKSCDYSTDFYVKQAPIGTAGYAVLHGTNYRPADYDCPGSKTPGYCQFDGSAADAQANCDRQIGCQGFVFILGANTYYLKGGPGRKPLDLRSTSDDSATDFYYNPNDTVQGRYGSPDGYAIYRTANYPPADFNCPGTQAPGYCRFSGSASDAKTMCDRQPGCQGFVYILGPQGHFYYLKGGPGSAPLDVNTKTCDPATDLYIKQSVSGSGVASLAAAKQLVASAPAPSGWVSGDVAAQRLAGVWQGTTYSPAVLLLEDSALAATACVDIALKGRLIGLSNFFTGNNTLLRQNLTVAGTAMSVAVTAADVTRALLATGAKVPQYATLYPFALGSLRHNYTVAAGNGDLLVLQTEAAGNPDWCLHWSVAWNDTSKTVMAVAIEQVDIQPMGFDAPVLHPICSLDVVPATTASSCNNTRPAQAAQYGDDGLELKIDFDLPTSPPVQRQDALQSTTQFGQNSGLPQPLKLTMRTEFTCMSGPCMFLFPEAAAATATSG
ncbi:hypothetical protein WJX72_002792 [[Myrmecia] bisecta]|uniref:Uncharacterized protein n=1 Tax=[Myrmecia] bisecta TaxID=41462 RepID=A0AAW1PZY9_9CHLO